MCVLLLVMAVLVAAPAAAESLTCAGVEIEPTQGVLLATSGRLFLKSCDAQSTAWLLALAERPPRLEAKGDTVPLRVELALRDAVGDGAVVVLAPTRLLRPATVYAFAAEEPRPLIDLPQIESWMLETSKRRAAAREAENRKKRRPATREGARKHVQESGLSALLEDIEPPADVAEERRRGRTARPAWKTARAADEEPPVWAARPAAGVWATTGDRSRCTLGDDQIRVPVAVADSADPAEGPDTSRPNASSRAARGSAGALLSAQGTWLRVLVEIAGSGPPGSSPTRALAPVRDGVVTLYSPACCSGGAFKLDPVLYSYTLRLTAMDGSGNLAPAPGEPVPLLGPFRETPSEYETRQAHGPSPSGEAPFLPDAGSPQGQPAP